jgi:hypothetical protein
MIGNFDFINTWSTDGVVLVIFIVLYLNLKGSRVW